MVQNFCLFTNNFYPDEIDHHIYPENRDEYEKTNGNILKTVDEINKVLVSYREHYINEDFINNVHSVFGDEDILFVPIKVPEGSIFLHHKLFDQYDDDQISEFILKEGGMDISYNLRDEVLIILHANFGYENCFQFNGKYDYSHLGKKLDTDHGVCGRFTAEFFTEDGEEYSVNEIIFQDYEEGQLDTGWESNKVDADGTFQVEREVEEKFIGSGALKTFFGVDNNVNLEEIEKWFDTDYVAKNARA